ncbi:MAG: SDR family oxidoreductase [Bacteroidota bacterium]
MRRVALVTGVSRGGIEVAVTEALADDAWDVATAYLRGYDAAQPWGNSVDDLDSVVLAAPHELALLGIAANVVNPGPTESDWMSDDLDAGLAARTPGGRVGRPDGVAWLVCFLRADEGRRGIGQRLNSNGGFA